MINIDRLTYGISTCISSKFEKSDISLQKTIDNGFNFWYLKVGYKLSFYADEQKRLHFSMKVSDLEGVFNGMKACIEKNARSNNEIDKTHYLNRKKVSEQKIGIGSEIEIKCRIKKAPNPKIENDERTFYNTLWAYIIQPAMRGVWESMQKSEHAQKRKCA